MWFIMYSIAFSYPSKPTTIDKHNTMNFFNYLGKVLPCDACKSNFQEHLKKFPLNSIAMENKYELIKWLVNINNEVNKYTGKRNITIDEMYTKYKNIYEEKDKLMYKVIWALIGVIILIAFLYKFN